MQTLSVCNTLQLKEKGYLLQSTLYLLCSHTSELSLLTSPVEDNFRIFKNFIEPLHKGCHLTEIEGSVVKGNTDRKNLPDFNFIILTRARATPWPLPNTGGTSPLRTGVQDDRVWYTVHFS